MNPQNSGSLAAKTTTPIIPLDTPVRFDISCVQPPELWHPTARGRNSQIRVIMVLLLIIAAFGIVTLLIILFTPHIR